MKILSLFDGMACGMIAMQNAGIPVQRYDAYEIDKYAIKVAEHNFPQIKEHGDVFKADFTRYAGEVDFLIGGSPCTYWSIAQKNGRETEASGIGWELFQQYVRAIKEAKPRFFIYENNKSMSKQIRASIDEAFGFEAVLINSALVSAQNRQRLYWVGKRTPDGTYRKVIVEQPQDRGILLRDILESGTHDKAYCFAEPVYQGNARYLLKNLKYENEKTNTLTASCYKGIGTDGMCTVAEPVNVTADGKSQCLRATYYKDGIRNMVGNDIDKKTCVAEPVPMAVDLQVVGRKKNANGEYERTFEAKTNQKSSALTSVEMRRMVAEPIRVGTKPNSDGRISGSQSMRIYSVDGKSVTQSAGGGGVGAKTGLYAVPVTIEWCDGKQYTVYEVKNGFITIKDKQYPIKLADGFYIIRKLTVRECMRLQTVPEWYDFSVISNSQAYKCLGNGWTCDVISHLIRSTISDVSK